MTVKRLFICGDFEFPQSQILFHPVAKIINQILPGRISNCLSLKENFKTQSAFVVGRSYLSKLGTPGVVLEGEDHIRGQIIELDESEMFWRLMDEFIGYNPTNHKISSHIRTKTSAVLDSGERCEVWVYQINPSKIASNYQLISAGDWKAVFEEGSLLTDRLSEKQKSYVKKLGLSSGREVIPIDLQLYRELMKLDLIVDKGRRLALSKLGQEVFKYID